MNFHRVDKGAGSELRIVWLHGWGQSHASLLKIGEFFGKKAGNHFFDLPGFGATPMLAAGAGTADYAAALAGELERIPAKRRVLIGHSFGCRVATRLAAARPDLVDGIVFIGGAGIPRDRPFRWKARVFFLRLLRQFAGAWDGLFGTGMLKAYRERFGSADYKAAGALRETFVAVVNENLTEDARRVSVPVLLLYGAEDTETPPDIGRKFQAAFPNAELHILTGFGHNDILSRGAAQCQTLINRFLDKNFPDKASA